MSKRAATNMLVGNAGLASAGTAVAIGFWQASLARHVQARAKTMSRKAKGFMSVKKGDSVERLLGGSVPMELVVTDVTETEIVCGPWRFCRLTGGEIDEDLEWDGIHTGSVLREPI